MDNGQWTLARFGDRPHYAGSYLVIPIKKEYPEQTDSHRQREKERWLKAKHGRSRLSFFIIGLCNIAPQEIHTHTSETTSYINTTSTHKGYPS